MQRCAHRRTPLWFMQDRTSQSAHRYEAGQRLDSGLLAGLHRSPPAPRQNLPERVPEDGTTTQTSLSLLADCAERSP